MIKVYKEEIINNEEAICKTSIYLFGYLIFSSTFKTNNKEITDSFNYGEKITVKGFNNETED